MAKHASWIPNIGIFSVLLMLVVSGAIVPQTDAASARVDSWCSKFDDVILVDFTSILDRADRMLPNIPPEEEKYLKAESAAVMRDGPFADENHPWVRRFGELTQRRFYYAWKAREALVDVRVAAAAILDPLPGYRVYVENPEAEKLRRAISALTYLDLYVNSAQDFLRRQQELSAREHDRVTFDLHFLRHILHQYLNCKLAKAVKK